MQSLPIHSIQPSPHNPRKFFAADGLAELAESIRQVGVLQPIVVRPVNGHFELVAGERRWRAAASAGLETIPGIVKELSDEQAAELAIVENLQRQDISPMEEAMGFRRLIELGVHTAESLAEKLGKSRSHVFGRLRLCKLGQAIRDAMVEGKIEASTAELLSKFDTEALQEEALTELLGSVAGWAEEDELPIPFRRAKRLLQDFYPNLADAPWPLRREDWPGGSCKACPKRAGNMPDAPAAAKGPNVCTDRHCYRDRLRRYRQQRLDELQAAGSPTLPTLEEHDEVFGNDWNNDNRAFWMNSKYVSAMQRCYDAKKGEPTWEKLLEGLEAPWLLLITPDGQTLRVLEQKEAYRVGREAGLLRADTRAGDAPVDRKAVIEENRKQKFIANELAKVLIDGAAQTPSKAFLAMALISITRRQYHARKYITERFGFYSTEIGDDGQAALLEEFQKLSLEQLQALLVTLEITASGGLWGEFEMKSWASRLGVDVDAVQAEAAKEYSAANKPRGKKG